MNSLSSDPQNPVGYFVDHLERNRDGNFEKTHSYDQYQFTKFRWQEDPKGNGHILKTKICNNFYGCCHRTKTTAYEYPQVLTHFLFKITMPLLSLLVVIASSPFCLRYSRNLPTFFTYTIALFGFIAFFALMDAAVIVGENHVVSPYVAILLPLDFAGRPLATIIVIILLEECNERLIRNCTVDYPITAPGTWRLKALLLCHIIGAMLFASLFWQVTKVYWEMTDIAFFKMVNSTLRDRPNWQLFWALANHKLADWVEDFCILGFFIAYIRSAHKSLRLKRVSHLVFCIVYIGAIIYFINRMLFRENLSIPRPSLLLSSMIACAYPMRSIG